MSDSLGQNESEADLPGATPREPRHTRGQRFIRGLFKVFGPAQAGPPPYANADELAAYNRSLQGPAVPPRTEPVGFEVREHVDDSGHVTRYLVARDRPDTAG